MSWGVGRRFKSITTYHYRVLEGGRFMGGRYLGALGKLRELGFRV